jgi:predicted TIM-barrel fold metal-dependent hydrolase
MIIDFRVTAPTAEALSVFLQPPEHLERLVRAYAHACDPDALGDYAEDIMGTSFANRIRSSRQLLEYMGDAEPGAFIEMLDVAGIDVALIQGADARTSTGEYVSNDAIARLQHRSKGRLIGAAGADPLAGHSALRELHRAVSDLGLRALNLGPQPIPPDDPRCYPLYAIAVEKDIPVIVHTSSNLSPQRPQDFSHPRRLDAIAMHFPELKLVANHAGWPWVLDLIALAIRHENLYISPAGMRPRSFADPASGWSPLVHYGSKVLRHKVLWGSTWPLLPLCRTIREVRELPLSTPTADQWLGGNAMQLLGVA